MVGVVIVKHKQIEHAKAELLRHGATNLVVDVSHKHPRVYFTYKDKRRFYVASRSPSDWRSQKNLKMEIRHLLGIAREKKPEKLRPQPERVTRPAPQLDNVSIPITPGRDGFAVLVNHPLYRKP